MPNKEGIPVMARYLAALFALLLAVSGLSAADAKKVTIRWHGQSFFDIESSQGTRIATDPHAIENFGPQHVSADLVLVSHFHNDHSQVGVIERRNPRAEIKVLYGLKRDKNNREDWNPIDEDFKDVHIRTIGVYHDDVQGTERGKNAVFIITVDGLKIVHLGDLGHQLSDLQIKNIGPVDVLMIPIGGVYTLNGSEAKRVVAALKPRKYILPMHYGTKDYDSLLPADEFIDGQKPGTVKQMFDTNKLEVATDFKPADPLIVLLGWQDPARRTPGQN
jgi:L-ascorbate metabolism protein UlaG (beta-lactamase superfamily)